MVSEKSCGGIVFLAGSPMRYLLLKNNESGGGHWDFPKGHVEPGESEEETALREIYEETKLNVSIIGGFRESISYFDNINSVDKTVVFFLCIADDSDVECNPDEIESHVWL